MAGNLENIAPVIVLAVPLPAQSHLNQLLHLSSFISTYYDLPLHYVCSSTHLRQAKLRFPNPHHLLNKIQFHDLPLPPFPILPPTRGGITDFPTHLMPLFEATMTLREPFNALLHKFSSLAKKIIIIHDPSMSYVVQDATSLIPNVELYVFDSCSAFFTFTFFNELANGAAIPIPEEIDFPNDIPSLEGCFDEEMAKFVDIQTQCMDLKAGHIQNTCRVIEGDYVDLLVRLNENATRWTVGPLNELVSFGKQRSSDTKEMCLDWLDKQPPNSVVYISFGTTSTLTVDQVRELANGFEESEIRFIWVLNDADKVDIFTKEDENGNSLELSKGFEERIEGVGMVVRGWAPQVKILNHPSTGGFMSHCGWGSCMESISAGVPIAAWPMHSDQPRNATFVTKVLKIGVEVKEWSRRKDLVTSSTVKKSLKTLIASEEGEMMRKRARELGASMRQATKEGGISRLELDSFIKHITK